MKLTFCDFFAGIGGFRLGLERAGHQGLWACEIEDFPRKVYEKNFGHLPQGKDINNVQAEDIPKADLWCGGFPCQDLSISGKRGGLQANRSGLFWVWHELIKERKPKWLFIENVLGLLSSNNGKDFQLLLSALAESSIPMPRSGVWPNAGLIRGNGLEVSWRVLNSQYFGLAQRRNRVFIIKYTGKGSAAEILFQQSSSERNTFPQRSRGDNFTANIIKSITEYSGTFATFSSVFPTLATGRPHSASTSAGWQSIVACKKSDSDRMRKTTRLPGQLDSSIDSPDSIRYKALGNAVAVPVIEWIGKRLFAFEEEK